jgi:xanthine dehydrogenase accessory factor
VRPVQSTAATVAEWIKSERRVAAGLLVAVDGSAPLKVGASMYIDADGAIEGNITGGCVEGAVVEEGLRILSGGGGPRLVTYGISDELAGTVGLMCGGTVHVFIHELAGESRAAALRGLEALVCDRPSAVATLLDGPRAGAKLYVDAEDRVGSLGGPDLLDINVEREARGLLAHGRTMLRHFGEDGTTLGTGLRVHVTAHADPPRMVIIGAIDFSASLAGIASSMGYRVTIADPRRAFLESGRFSAHAETLSEWPQDVLARMTLNSRDAILVFSHDPKLDTPAVLAACATGAGYIGALGSRKTTRDRQARLREAGATDADLSRIFAPAGLDIGAATVEETAIAVLAEIIAHRSGRTGDSLRDSSGPIRRAEAHGPELAAPMPGNGSAVGASSPST